MMKIAKVRDFMMMSVAGNCLRRGNWPINQYFEIRLSGSKGYISANQLLDVVQLSKRSQLRRQAIQLMEQMQKVLTAGNTFQGLDLFVFSFDRYALLFGKTVMFRARIEQGKIVEIEEVPVESDNRLLTKTDLMQLEKLKSFPLSPNQFFIPWYLKDQKEKTRREEMNTLCLVNLSDTLFLKSSRKKSKRLYNELLPNILPGGPFKWITIKYQSSLNQKLTTSHTYKIKKAPLQSKKTQ